MAGENQEFADLTSEFARCYVVRRRKQAVLSAPENLEPEIKFVWNVKLVCVEYVIVRDAETGRIKRRDPCQEKVIDERNFAVPKVHPESSYMRRIERTIETWREYVSFLKDKHNQAGELPEVTL
jgi:hypothetical protein